jgi:hypothetical protein
MGEADNRFRTLGEVLVVDSGSGWSPTQKTWWARLDYVLDKDLLFASVAVELDQKKRHGVWR